MDQWQDVPQITNRTGVTDEPMPRVRRGGPDGIGTDLPIPSLGEFCIGLRRHPFGLAFRLEIPQSLRAGKPPLSRKGGDVRLRAGDGRRPILQLAGLNWQVYEELSLDCPQGLKTKPGPIITVSGILGRSSNSSGYFFITFRMCLGSMCLLTSKVALSTPRRSKVSCALHSAR